MKSINFKLGLLALVLVVASCKDEETPKPVAMAEPAAQSISSGETTSVKLSSTISGTTFNWTVAQSAVSGASAGSGSTIAQTLMVDGADTGTATYTVTPTAGGVTGDPITVIVTVNMLKMTYNADVKPLLVASCTPCHVAGGTHPKKWDEYETTKSSINGILYSVKLEPGQRGFMPYNGTKLSDENIAILEKWVEDGLLEE